LQNVDIDGHSKHKRNNTKAKLVFIYFEESGVDIISIEVRIYRAKGLKEILHSNSVRFSLFLEIFEILETVTLVLIIFQFLELFFV